MSLPDKSEGALRSCGAVTSSLTQKFPQKSLPLPYWSHRHEGALEGYWHPQTKPVSDHSWESPSPARHFPLTSPRFPLSLASPVLGRAALLSSRHFSLPDDVELCCGYHTIVLGLLQEQTPGSSLHQREAGLKRNMEEKNHHRRLFSEEAENLNSYVHGVFEKGPLGLYIKEVSFTPIKEDRKAMAGEGVQITPHPGCSPAQHRRESHQPAEGPPPQAQRSTGAEGQVGEPN